MPVAVAAPARWIGSGRRVARVLRRVLKRLRRPDLTVSVALVTPARSAALNRRYRRTARPANVLAFSLDQSSGELILCPTVAAAEAPGYGRTTNQHLDALAVHGLLHLLGQRHVRPPDRRRMERRERQLLAGRW